MPGYPSGATQFETPKVVSQWKDARGKTSTKTFYPGNDSATEAQMRAVVAGMALFTNAGLMHDDVIFNRHISPNAVVAYDEAESSVTVELVLLYQSPTTEAKKYVRIPAPDAQFFAADGETFVPSGGSWTTLNTAVLAALNAGSGDYEFVRGYALTPGRKSAGVVLKPTVEEPGETGQPGDLPGEFEA